MVQAQCPDCGSGNCIRPSKDPTYIYCGKCGWVADTESDTPEADSVDDNTGGDQ